MLQLCQCKQSRTLRKHADVTRISKDNLVTSQIVRSSLSNPVGRFSEKSSARACRICLSHIKIKHEYAFAEENRKIVTLIAKIIHDKMLATAVWQNTELKIMSRFEGKFANKTILEVMNYSKSENQQIFGLLFDKKYLV